MSKRSYSPEFKLQVVLEALSSDRTDAEIARAYDIHPAVRVGVGSGSSGAVYSNPVLARV